MQISMYKLKFIKKINLIWPIMTTCTDNTVMKTVEHNSCFFHTLYQIVIMLYLFRGNMQRWTILFNLANLPDWPACKSTWHLSVVLPLWDNTTDSAASNYRHSSQALSSCVYAVWFFSSALISNPLVLMSRTAPSLCNKYRLQQSDISVFGF